MAIDKFKLPRSSYEELSKIIVAYSKFNAPASLDELTKLTGILQTGISANNAFLTAVGLIEGGKGKAPSQKCIKLGQALGHDIQEEIARVWAIVIQENEFLGKILQAIGIRKGMEETQLKTHIAYSAGEPKSKEVMTGARTVIDILRVSGLVVERDGQITLSSSPPLPSQDEPGKINSDSTVIHRVKETPINYVQGKTHIPYSIQIEIRINATPEELSGLGNKIKELITSLEAETSEQEAEH